MKMIKLLFVEDDVNLSYIIKNSLEGVLGDYEVCLASNGEEGFEHFKTFTPDVIVSDIEMPVINGLEMVKMIRKINLDLPVIFATGKISSKDVTCGYEAGVDNYIKKPFTPEELDAHVKALINIKSNSRLRFKNPIYKIGKYTFDPKSFTLMYNDSEKRVLTAKESQILILLLDHKGEIVKRDDILKTFWPESDYFTSRSLDVFITKLRGYLSQDTSVSIKNIKSTGLILDFD
jgi:DNA-binding response OmpR family regulator